MHVWSAVANGVEVVSHAVVEHLEVCLVCPGLGQLSYQARGHLTPEPGKELQNSGANFENILRLCTLASPPYFPQHVQNLVSG